MTNMFLERETTVYLAGPFSWREPLQVLADKLRERRLRVTSRWMTAHAPHGDDMAAYTETELAAYGMDDLADIRASDALVLVNPKTAGGGGGRWTELGYALALRKKVVLVGERSNPFGYLVAWAGAMPELVTDMGKGSDTAIDAIAEVLRIFLPDHLDRPDWRSGPTHYSNPLYPKEA